MEAKICGVKDLRILNYIINHKYPPKFIGFIANYKKSRRYLEFEELKKLVKTRKDNINYVCVLVNPNNEILKKIKKLNFDYYQLYNVTPKKTKMIKKKFNIKIITALTVKNLKDVLVYKNYEKISEIILFDSKGYEKSLGFDHKLLSRVPKSLKKMLAGNIKYNDKLEKFNKIADIIDISGSLETFGKKNISKINIFLNNIKKINDEN